MRKTLEDLYYGNITLGVRLMVECVDEDDGELIDRGWANG